MAKKQRRKQQIRQMEARPAPAAATPAVRHAASTLETRGAPAQASTLRAKSGATWEEFQGRYSHVNVELKQIGMLAGSFLIVLLILAAVLG
jgi:hypothetical protein